MRNGWVQFVVSPIFNFNNLKMVFEKWTFSASKNYEEEKKKLFDSDSLFAC